MAQNLPEELLRGILSCVLHIPDNVLNNTRLPSPFAHVEFSTSSVLLVCKRWMRAGTSPLYGTVILRTRAQALALCNALKQNPAFASCIKRLRLEGRSAEVLGNAHVMITELEQLCLAPDYTGTTRSNGLLKFMRCTGFNLHTIAIAEPEGLNHDQKASFHAVIKEVLPSWDRLRTIVLPPTRTRFLGLNPALIFRVVTDAAAHCSNLNQLYLAAEHLSELTVLVSPLLWDILHAVPQCRLIISAPNTSSAHIRTFGQRIPIQIRARVFVCTQVSFESCNTEVAAKPNWHNSLNDAAPEIQTSIWRFIVDFATRADADSFYQSPHSPWFESNCFDVGTAKALLLTNRRLSNLVICALARHLDFNHDRSAVQLLDTLLRRPSVALMIRSVTIGRCPPAAPDILHRATNLQSVTEQLRLSPGDLAQIFDAIRVSGAFRKLKRVDLVALNSNIPVPSRAADLQASINTAIGPIIDGGIFLDGLDSLEYLKWRRRDIPFTTPPSPGALKNVTTISTLNDCGEFLKWLALCSLACLSVLSSGGREFVEPSTADTSAFTSFLTNHGSKITELALESNCNFSTEQFALCTHLITLRLRDECCPGFLDTPLKAPSVKTIYVDAHEPWDSSQPSASWERLQKVLDDGAFTSLKDLHFTWTGEAFWPTTDSALGQDAWQVIAAEKLKARGIAVYDGHGRAYRPRLQISDVARRSSRVSRS